MIILDGGMGRELERMGAPFKQPEWSALALMEQPESVYEAHKNFIAAGAQIITTNAYAVIPFHIGEERFQKQGAGLIHSAAKLAERAVQDPGKDVQIAGCIPPLFGSYKPEDFDVHAAAEIMAPFIEQQRDIVDFWLVETMPSALEALAMCSILQKSSHKPIWLALTVSERKDSNAPVTLRSGELLEQALEKIVAHFEPDALLYNCSRPEDIQSAIELTQDMFGAKHLSHIRIGAYANNFVKCTLTETDISETRSDINQTLYLEFAKKWADAGASIIGGCCGIGPEYIELLYKELKD